MYPLSIIEVLFIQRCRQLADMASDNSVRLAVRVSLPATGKDKLVNALNSVLKNQEESERIIALDKVIQKPQHQQVWQMYAMQSIAFFS